MPDILHDFFIKATPEQVYDMVSTGEGLDRWWTKRAKGEAMAGKEFVLWFSPEYDWRARVTHAQRATSFEIVMTRSDDDWHDTRIRFEFERLEGGTRVRFAHSGWAEASEHFRVSSYCWAMYLRLLKRYLEKGEMVEYQYRDDA